MITACARVVAVELEECGQIQDVLDIQLKEFVNGLRVYGHEEKGRAKMAPRFLAHKTGE